MTTDQQLLFSLQLEAVEGKHRLAFLGGAAVKGVAPGAVPAARGPSDGFGPRVDGRQAAASVSDEAVRMKPWGPRATGLDNKGRRVTSVRRWGGQQNGRIGRIWRGSRGSGANAHLPGGAPAPP